MSVREGNPRVSVILCTYTIDMYEHFREAAESVLEQTYDPVELVVVVDGSSIVYDRVSDDYGSKSSVKIRYNDENLGLLRSRNIGAELADGEVVAFIDDDAIADRRWIDELVQCYSGTDRVAVGGKMVPEWIDGQPKHLPEEYYWLIGVTHRGFPEEAGVVRNTFGSNISFRRLAFLELEGFNPEIGGRKGDKNLQGGETELCSRIRSELGQGVYYTPEAIVAHKIFTYRTRWWWLINRAFWQGYSKRGMKTHFDSETVQESDYLRRLLTEFMPGRMYRLVRSPSVVGFTQLLALIVLTASVGFGYLYGGVRWR